MSTVIEAKNLNLWYGAHHALLDVNIPVILTFILGAVIGIVSFSNLLTWLFKHYEMLTLAALTGFMFGSLNKIWPWKRTLETYIDRHGVAQPLAQENILPANIDGEFFYAIGLIVLGVVLMFAIELLSKKFKTKTDA